MRNLALLGSAAILAVLAGVPLATQVQSRRATPSTSMSTVVATSAALDAKNRQARQSTKSKIKGNKPQQMAAAGGPYSTQNIVIPAAQTGTGFNEYLTVMTPYGYTPGGGARPLLLVGNGYGLSPASFFNGMSDIPDEANNRGWLICATIQLDDQSFGAWNKPQSNVTASLDYMIANYAVDVDRIYAVGWSMSGGSLASYAARHLDPARPMIAALVTNAGSFDLVDTYDNEVTSVKQIMENAALFAGPPSNAAYTFHYERTETVLTNPVSGIQNQTYSQARNLLHIPTYHVYSADDTIPYLPVQNQQFASFMQSVGANITTQAFTGLANKHSWQLIDEVAALDFLEQFTVARSPTSFDILADRNATYYWTSVTQRNAGSYSRVKATATTATNSLVLDHLQNVSALTVRVPNGMLNLTSRLDLTIDNDDTLDQAITLTGTPILPPNYILVNNQAFTDWSYDASGIRINAPANSANTYVLTYDSYTAVATTPTTVNLGFGLPLTLASKPNMPYLAFLSTYVAPVPLSLIDPGDPRWFLAGVGPTTAFFGATMPGSGSVSFNVGTPSDPVYSGTILSIQFLTYPGSTTIVDEISNLAQCRLQ